MLKENKVYNKNIISSGKWFAVLFACMCSTLFAQYDTIRSYYSSGKIESIIPTYNKVPEGNALYFSETGKIKAERNYVSGKIEGVVKLYYESGKLKELFTIENGKREGPASYFDTTGEFAGEDFYSNGLKQPLQPSDTAGVVDPAEVNLTKINTGQEILPPKIVESKEPVRTASSSPAEQSKPEVKEREPVVVEKLKSVPVQITPVVEQAKPKAEVKVEITNAPLPIIENTKNVNASKDNQLLLSTKDTLTLDLTDSLNPVIKLFDQVPAPASGIKFFNEKLNYPSYAKKKNISGTVVIKALVHENGDIMSVEVYKSVEMNLDEAALIAVNYTKFTPAIYHSIPVKVYMLYPVEFKLKK